MGKLVTKTRVRGTPRDIIDSIDKELILALTPPLSNLEITRFDGNQKGHIKTMVASVAGYYQSWNFQTIDNFLSDRACYFIDEAKEMPYPLTYWKYVFKVDQVAENECLIIEEVFYRAENKLVEITITPVIYSLMYFRKPIYMDRFSE